MIELALPVANWQKKTSEERTQDIASVALEWQGKANIYWTTPEQIIRLTDTNKTDTETGFNENTATFEVVQWFFSDAECLGWLSALKDGVYETTRFGLKKKYSDGGRKIRILNVDVYLKIPVDECIGLYAKFVGEDVGDISVEDFRDRPVEFNLPEGKTFNDLIREFTGKNLVELMSEKDVVTQDATKIEQENSNGIESAGTEYKQILVGARIEEELIKRGHAISRSIGCPGVSNREALRMLNALSVPEDGMGVIKTLNPDRYVYDKYDKCKKCEEMKMVVSPPQGCGICRDCQILFDLGVYQ